MAQGWPPPHHSRQIRHASIADPSPTIHPDRADPAVPVVRALALVVRDPAAPVVPVVHMDRADLVVLGRVDRVVLVVLARVDRAVLVVPEVLARVGLVALTVPAALVVLDPAVLVGPAVLVAPNMADLVAPARMDRVVQVARVAGLDMADLVVPAALARMVPAARADPVVLRDQVGPNMVARVVPAGPVARNTAVQVDRPRRRTCSAVSMSVVARNGAVRETHRTASALPITARRPRPARTGSGGTVDPLLEARRLTGRDRLLLVDGTDRRLRAAGTRAGMGRHATSASHSAITGRSTTAASTPYRCSTHSSVAGASGSSAPGSRCTDLSSA
ncbi:MAG: hypothetical protein QOD34_3749 [Mycobacterium sp.]|nr:hypothetical protein [Mycobacterium sp.]